MTPALGGPGMMRKGTVECLLAESWRSYRRRMSYEALEWRVSCFLGGDDDYQEGKDTRANKAGRTKPDVGH